MTHTIKIHNVETGEVTEREMTKAEADHFDFVRKQGDAEQLVREQILALKTEALTKLEALGLSSDDLKALGF